MFSRRVVLLALLALVGVALAVGVAGAASLTAGALDPSYGSGGVVDEDFFGTQNNDSAAAVAIQGNGDIVVAGDSGADGFDRAFVARYTSSGARDTTFGPAPGGFSFINVGLSGSYGTTHAQAVAVEPDGDIVVAGTALNNEAFFVNRYLPNGTLDPSFATAGGNLAGEDALQLSGHTSGYKVTGVAVQSNGEILVSGSAGTAGFVARILSEGGALDTSYGNANGAAVLSGIAVGGISLPASGTIVAVGTLQNEVLPFHLSNTGSASGGNTYEIGSDYQVVAGLVATAAGGSIVATTDAQAVTPRIGLFAFTAANALDTTFGSGTGEEALSLPNNDAPIVNGITIDSAGRLIVVGQDTTTHHMFLLRTLANGTLDTSFGLGGWALPSVNASDSAVAVAVDGSDNPVVAGVGIVTGRSDTDALSARFLATTPPAPTTTTTSTTPAPTSTAASTSTPVTTTTPGTTTSTPTQSTTTGVVTAALSKVAAKRAKFTAQKGTSFSFTLSHAATVTFSFTQLLTGRRVGKKCVAQTRKNAHAKACTRSVSAGSFTRAETAGAHTVAFTGKVGTKKLAAGRYSVLVSVVATETTVGTGAKTLSFTIIP